MRATRWILTITLALVAGEVAGASTARAAVDVTAYDVEIALDTAAKTLDGHALVTLVADGGAEIALDLVGLTVSAVRLDGADVPFAHDGERLAITPAAPPAAGSAVTLEVTYGGAPTPYVEPWGTWGIVWEAERVFAVNVTEGARRWFPCHDTPADKATFAIAVTAPAAWSVAAPGVLLGSEPTADATGTTWRWAADWPVATYLMAFYAGAYTLHEETLAGGLPFQVWLNPTPWDTASTLMAHAPAALDVFTARYGPYPFNKLGWAEIALSGAVEVPSCVGIGTAVLGSATDFSDVIAHEVSHSWFQGVVTVGAWDDLWISEGLATYHEVLYREATAGAGSARSHVADLAAGYKLYTSFGEGIIAVTAPPRANLFGATVYNKGALIFHMLRYLLGDAAFDAALTQYLADFSQRSAVAADLRAVFEASAGVDLADFWAQWVEGAGWPQYTFAWRTPADAGTGVDVRVAQTQVGGQLYTLPLEVELRGAAGESHRATLPIGAAVVAVRLDPGFVVTEATLDPDGWVLADVITASYPDEPSPVADAGPEPGPERGPEAGPAADASASDDTGPAGQIDADASAGTPAPGARDEGCAAAPGAPRPWPALGLLLATLAGAWRRRRLAVSAAPEHRQHGALLTVAYDVHQYANPGRRRPSLSKSPFCP